uniref:Proton-coupled zinc antiporter SLC30A8 n=1 Tax=Geotrypetes seraphini TaxID=260995 RepID=A0A6P8QQG7_GEOSA|nr:zinc transporter 8 isoform X2 [Geotrypetes seraphini]
MKGPEKAYLVSERAIKMYSIAENSFGSAPEQNRANEEKLSDEDVSQSNGSYHCHNTKAREIRKMEHNQAKQKLYIASAVCLTFMITEIVGGYIAGSLAVMADAAHLLVDLTSFLISLSSLWISSKPATKRLNFGWHRAEILGALLSMIVIWVMTGVLVYLASERMLHPNYKIEGKTMLITSVCALIANVILGLILHQRGHGHSHGASTNEQSSSSEHRLQANSSVRAAFIHAIGDLFQSISVPEYKLADPICTFVFSVFILGTTITTLRATLVVLMEGTPQGINYNAVKKKILEVNGVSAVHCLHLWALTMNQVILSAHVVIGDATDPKQILKVITRVVYDNFIFHSVTIQVEQQVDQKPDCISCQDPID